MKHATLTAALVLLASIATAQTKVGYIDIGQITRKSKPVSNMMDDIRGEIEELQKEMESTQRKLRDLQSDVRKNDGVLSASDLDGKRKEITKLQNELSDMEAKAKKKAQEMDSTVLEPMLKNILFRVEDVAKEKGIDLVLRGEAVIYGTKAVDLTDAVIEKLNKEGGSGSTTETRAGSSKEEPESTPRPKATPKEEGDALLPMSSEPAKTEGAPAAAAAPEKTSAPTKKPEATKASGTPSRRVDRQQD